MKYEKLTLKQLAKKIKMSSSTVCRAINPETKHMVNAKTVEIIDKSVKKYGYVPNLAGKMLRKNITNTIGVLVDFDMNFFTESYYWIDVLGGIISGLNKTDYDLKIISERKFNNINQLFSRNAVDGLIVLNWGFNPEMFNIIKNEGLDYKIIILNKFFNKMKANVLYADNEKAAYMAVKYLINKGCRKIAHIKGALGCYDSEARFNGYCKALKDSCIEFDKKLVEHGHYFKQGGMDAGEKLLKNNSKIDAFFCSNDNMAVGLLKILKKHNILCPEQIKVIGFDGTSQGEITNPLLTTVSGSPIELGQRLVFELISIIENKKRRYVQTMYDFQIIERESTV